MYDNTGAAEASPYMTRSEAAAFLRLSPATLANRASKGLRPRCVRLDGGHTLYARAELIDWVESQREAEAVTA